MNYDTTVPWDLNLIDVWYSDIDNPLVKGLVKSGIYIVAGAPAATPGYFIPGCIINNAVDANAYINIGSTAAPIWVIMDNASDVPKNNLTATIAPTNLNDNTQGYSIGSLWFNKSSGLMYVAESVATATAVWTVVGGAGIVQTATVSLTSLQILALNTTAIQLVPAPGAGKAIQVLAVMGNMSFLTAAYATHTELDIIDATTGDVLLKDTGTLLAATSSKVAQIPANINANAGIVVTSNGAVQIKVPTGNPTGGSGTLKVYITYTTITL